MSARRLLTTKISSMNGKLDHNSANKLTVCDERLIKVFVEVRKIYDFKVICGYRGQKDQHDAFCCGNSKLDWPKSKHNSLPSLAVDVLPACLQIDGKINWNDKEAFIKAYSELAELVFKEADKQGVHLRSGMDFHMDGSKTTNDMWDLPHWEVVLK